MNLKDVKIGFGVTGSHCTLKKVFQSALRLKEEGADLYPVFSPAVQSTDTRFGTAEDWQQRMEALSGKKVIDMRHLFSVYSGFPSMRSSSVTLLR